MSDRPFGLVNLPGDIKDLWKVWTPPPYVFEFWQTGAKVPYINHDDYILKKAEVLKSYEELRTNTNAN